MKDSYYFSHDSNALTDPKILSLRCDYGMEGYGIFWAVVEMLRNQNEYRLEFCQRSFKAIKMLCMTNIDIEEFLNKCINEYDLFKTDGKYIWSDSLRKRMDKKDDLAGKRSNAAKKRWNKDKSEYFDTEKTETSSDTEISDTNMSDVNANTEKETVSISDSNASVMQKINMQCKCNAKNNFEMQNNAKESKEKESKEKESKEKKVEVVVKKEKKNETATAVSENPFKESPVAKFYIQNIQAVPSGIQLEKICSWTDVMTEELIIKAMEIAVDANIRRYDYIKAILERFQDEGFKTVEDYNNAESIKKSFQKKNSANNNSGSTGNVFFDMLRRQNNDT